MQIFGIGNYAKMRQCARLIELNFIVIVLDYFIDNVYLLPCRMSRDCVRVFLSFFRFFYFLAYISFATKHGCAVATVYSMCTVTPKR